MATTAEQVNALITDQANKINYLYQQLEELKVQVGQVGKGQSKGAPRSMTHAKHFNPGKYSSLRGDQAFRPWAGDVKIMALRYSKPLHDLMNRTEYQKEPVRKERVQAEGITPEDDMELFMTLRAFTSGSAHALVENSLSQDSSALEAWRILVAAFDPDNDTSRMDESSFIMQPGKSKTLADVMDHLVTWEKAILHRTRTLGRPPLEDDMMRSALLTMLPPKEEQELRSQRVLYTTYEALRNRVCEIVFERTRDRAPMMMSMEKEDGDEGEEDDEPFLMKLDKLTGRYVKVGKGKGKGGGKGGWSKGGGKGGQPDYSDRECYRCGRTGHIRANCSALKHKNGGACKEPRAAMKSCEEDAEDRGGLDICALSGAGTTMRMSPSSSTAGPCALTSSGRAARG
jgi:hypothetical protein